MSVFFDPNDLETFVFETEDVPEFVDTETWGTFPNTLQGVSILGSLPLRSDLLIREIFSGI